MQFKLPSKLDVTKSAFKKFLSTIKMTGQVSYRLDVLESEENPVPVFSTKPTHNLILDSGLNFVGTDANGWAGSFEYAAVGTGTNPTQRDSSTITASRTGTTVTASAPFFEANDVGRLIRWDDGTESYVASFTSTTIVETVESGSVTGQEFTVWYVDDISLQTEVKRTNTYQTGAGDCQTTYSGGSNEVFEYKRTFLFSAEVGSVTYNEIGWAPANTGDLFGRDLITGGVALVAGNILRAVMTLSITYAGIASAVVTDNAVIGWTNDGDGDFRFINPPGSLVDSNGASVASSASIGNPGGFDPANNITVVFNASTAFKTYGAGDLMNSGGIIGTGEGLFAQAYSPDSFVRTKVGQWDVANGNGSTIRSIMFGDGNLSRIASGQMLFDDVQTKDSDHVVDLTLSLAWGRTLTN